MELFSVSKHMYNDAIEILYGRNCFDIAQDPVEIIKFLQNIPAAALLCIRSLHLRVLESQVCDWKENNYLQDWKALVQFIKENLQISRLSLTVDSEEIWDNLKWAYEQETNKYYYDAMVELADALTELRGLHDMWFKMGWFRELEKVFAHRIMGDKWVDRHGIIKPENHEWNEPWIVHAYHEERPGDLKIYSKNYYED